MVKEKVFKKTVCFSILSIVAFIFTKLDIIKASMFLNDKTSINPILFNILGVDAILVGFLFSAVSLFYSFNSGMKIFKTMKVLRATDTVIIDMISGIYFGMISIISTMILIIFHVENSLIGIVGISLVIGSILCCFIYMFFAFLGMIKFIQLDMDIRDKKIKEDESIIEQVINRMEK